MELLNYEYLLDSHVSRDKDNYRSELSSDPMVIQLDVVINGIYTRWWFIATSDKSYYIHLSLTKY